MIKNNLKKLLMMVLCIILIIQLLPFGAFALTGSQVAIAVQQHITTVPAGYKAIRTAADLNAVRNDLDGKYILMNDIDLSAATAPGGAYYNGGKGWIPIGYNEYFMGTNIGINVGSLEQFSGVFDGNGYLIKELKINSTGSMGIGLFSYNTGTIKNLAMINCKISVLTNTTAFTGSITGINNSEGIVSNCYSRSDVSAVSNGGFKLSPAMVSLLKLMYSDEQISEYQASMDAGIVEVGGITGLNTGLITDCYNTGNISATGRDEAAAGGITGAGLDGSKINNCYNLGSLYAFSAIGEYACGGIAGQFDDSTVTGCYYADTAAGAFGNVDDTKETTKCTATQIAQNLKLVTKIDLNYTAVKLDVGKSLTLTKTLTPSDAVNKDVFWLSNKANVASVDSNGKIIALYAGTAVITCYSKDGAAVKSCTVTVGKPVTKITLSAGTLNWIIGKSGSIKAAITPIDASIKTVSWATSNKNVATVDSDGLVKAIGLGKATITCTSKDGDGVKAVCVITVGKPVTSIKLSSTSLIGVAGKTGKLVPTIAPSDAINKSVIWSTSNKYIATVDSAGNVKIVGIGTAVITCSAADGSGKKVTCAVTGLPGTPTGVKAAKASTTSIKLTWSKVTGASGYEVYRSLSKTGTYTKIKTLTSTTYTNSGLSRGKTYYYKIVAYKTVGSKTLRSASSAIVYYKL